MVNQYGIKLDRNGYAPSLFKNRPGRCLLCERVDRPLQRHEVFHGPYRQKAKALGCWVLICDECHRLAHSDGAIDRNLKLVKYKYCCVLYDPHKNNIVDLLSCRHLNFLIDYFSHIPKDEKDAVEFVSMDMWESYRTMAKKCLPKAKIAVDSFHVVQQLNNAFNKIRIRVMKKYEDTKKQHGSYYWLYKKHWKLLLMDVGNSSYIKVNDKKTGMELSNLQIIDYMLELDDELRAAYDLKEAYREFNKLRNLDTAEYDLNQFVVKFKSFGKQAYLQFGKLLENWFREIINSFHVVDGRRVSNGKMERVNRDIKTISRSSYGSKNFIRTRNRVMDCINNDAYILNIRKDKTNSKPQLKPRGKYKK